jgi:hypothetical protein
MRIETLKLCASCAASIIILRQAAGTTRRIDLGQTLNVAVPIGKVSRQMTIFRSACIANIFLQKTSLYDKLKPMLYFVNILLAIRHQSVHNMA